MIKIARNWSRLNREERLAQATAVVGKLEQGGSAITSDPAFAALKEWLTATSKHCAAVRAMEKDLFHLRLRRDTAEDAMLTSLDAVADVLEKGTEGDLGRILATGFEPTEGAEPRAIPMTQVINFSISAGDFDGELDTHWDAVRGAMFYDQQICTGDPAHEKEWKDFNLTKPIRSIDSAYDPSEEFNRAGIRRTKATLTGLPSGKRVWVRVRAANPDGTGPWSEPRSKRVP